LMRRQRQMRRADQGTRKRRMRSQWAKLRYMRPVPLLLAEKAGGNQGRRWSFIRLEAKGMELW